MFKTRELTQVELGRIVGKVQKMLVTAIGGFVNSAHGRFTKY